MKKTIKIINYTLTIILSLAIVFFINGTFESFIVKNKINEFKERSIYIGKDENDKINTYYYRVPKEYEYEDTSRNIFNFNERWVGSKGDIIITNRNPMRDVPSLRLIVGFLAENYFVGHATLNSTEDGSELYEVIGNSSNPENNVVEQSDNSWIWVEERLGDESDSPIIIGLRIKDTTPEQRDQMVKYAESKVGMKYNFTFLFNRSNTFYCTDLVSRSVSSAGINVNYDYLATTGNDIIVSKNVYITFIREIVIENGIRKYNIYYLD